LEPEDVAQMQAQLTRAATDAAWRGHLRVAGLAHAASFHWKKTAAATLDVYARAARSAPLSGTLSRAPGLQPPIPVSTSSLAPAFAGKLALSVNGTPRPLRA
jgi:hypothetical protein